MAKRKLTAEDIEKDPSLVEKGYAVGDEYEFPEDEVNSEKSKSNEQETNEGGEGQGTTTTTPPTGGPQPPPDKERP